MSIKLSLQSNLRSLSRFSTAVLVALLLAIATPIAISSLPYASIPHLAISSSVSSHS